MITNAVLTKRNLCTCMHAFENQSLCYAEAPEGTVGTLFRSLAVDRFTPEPEEEGVYNPATLYDRQARRSVCIAIVTSTRLSQQKVTARNIVFVIVFLITDLLFPSSVFSEVTLYKCQARGSVCTAVPTNDIRIQAINWVYHPKIAC